MDQAYTTPAEWEGGFVSVDLTALRGIRVGTEPRKSYTTTSVRPDPADLERQIVDAERALGGVTAGDIGASQRRHDLRTRIARLTLLLATDSALERVERGNVRQEALPLEVA